jgi:transposase
MPATFKGCLGFRAGGVLKQFRRVATRYDTLLTNFMGFVTLAAIAILLR